MSRRIFVIDDDEVAREVALMLKQKENQRRGRYSSLMYDGGGNVIPYHVCEEQSSGCGSSGCGVYPNIVHSSCYTGGIKYNVGCGGIMSSSFGTCG